MSAQQSLPRPILDQIVRAIHGAPELRGCMIGYSRLGACQTLHRGLSPTINFRDKLVIVDHGSAPAGRIDARQVPARPTTTAEAPAYESNISKLGPELIGVGINLLAFTVSLAGVGGGAASTPATGPAGVAVAVASWTGLATSGIQTTNAIIRLWRMALDPYGNQLQQWDSSETYANFITIVDATGLVALGTVAGLAARAAVTAAASRHSALMRGMTPEKLKAMPKAAREQFLRNVHAQIVSTPAGKAELEAVLKKAKVSMAGAGRERHAAKLAGLMSPIAQQRLQQSVSRIVATQLARYAMTRDGRVTALSLGANVTDASVVGSSSGSMNRFMTGPERRKWLTETISVHILQRP